MVKSYFSRTLSVGFAAAVAAALLAGCGGSQALGPAPAGGASSSISHSPIVSPDVKGGKGGCKAHGGVRVSPCTVDFTASSTGPDTVVTRAPENKKGVLTESDNCGGASGIATVTQGSGDDWTVTAGASTGSCTATFAYTNKHGKQIGYADLSITNSI
ncbi:MAG TPA: hypothetical protein VKR56_11760 [Candidatus Cybelea sp.]|jgi:hypothetical protein|nr:hypothetical protein [Candidatus Cybelea sp.]